MPSRQYTVTTPWLRETDSRTRFVITLELSAEREGAQATWAMRVINEVHEIAMTAHGHIEHPSESDQANETECFDSLPDAVEVCYLSTPNHSGWLKLTKIGSKGGSF